LSENEKLATDRRSVQLLLRAGLAIATLLMSIGVSLKCASGRWDTPAIRLFDLVRGADLAAADRVMGLGILALAATPAFRVITLLGLWIRERDWRFAAVAAVVLATLALAIAMGGG
jgi:uncharacterized membrane protein